MYVLEPGLSREPASQEFPSSCLIAQVAQILLRSDFLSVFSAQKKMDGRQKIIQSARITCVIEAMIQLFPSEEMLLKLFFVVVLNPLTYPQGKFNPPLTYL